MSTKDYYAILGVSREADGVAIKRAYRRLARQYHPDLNAGDAEAERRFKEINEAYTVLSDDQKRQAYDRFGSDWKRQASDMHGFNWDGWFGDQASDPSPRGRTRTAYTEEFDQRRRGRSSSSDDNESGSFSDFFHQFFGEGRQNAGPRRTYTTRSGTPEGSAQVLPVAITLEEAFWGTKRTIQHGSERFDVTIPRGVDTGTRVRISRNQDFSSAQLTLQVEVKPHPQLLRDGDHLRTRIKIDLYTALLGGETQVPTMEGALVLVVPPNTQNGRVFRLKGQGMPVLKSPDDRGDLLAEVQVELPVPLSEEEKRRFSDLRRLRRDDDFFS